MALCPVFVQGRDLAEAAPPDIVRVRFAREPRLLVQLAVVPRAPTFPIPILGAPFAIPFVVRLRPVAVCVMILPRRKTMQYEPARTPDCSIVHSLLLLTLPITQAGQGIKIHKHNTDDKMLTCSW
jgi:hypothetical protein